MPQWLGDKRGARERIRKLALKKLGQAGDVGEHSGPVGIEHFNKPESKKVEYFLSYFMIFTIDDSVTGLLPSPY